MGNVYNSSNESELAMLQSLLEGQGIKVYISNNYSGSVSAYQNLISNNLRTIIVSDDQEQKALEIIRDYLQKVSPEKLSQMNPEDARKGDKTMWIILSVLIVGWILTMLIMKRF
jgi:hypothetical protein